jgi:hypothetical protein
MPKYVVERQMPGSGALTTRSLQKIAKRSCDTIIEMDANIQWIESFVTADKWFCIYIASDESLIREHAKRGDFPIMTINEVITIVDPVSAEGEFIER